jgi:glycosyltransferase involved in cell wall biosynthesis
VKVLMLPLNVASFPVISCNALNNISGIKARCVTQSLSKYQETSEDLIYLPREVPKRKVFKWIRHKLTGKRILKKLVKEADVLHYYWGPAYPNAVDLKWVRSFGKPIVVEWLGSDIRNPEILKECNPYFANIYENGYEYRENESVDNSQNVQKLFYSFNATPVLCPEMSLFLDRKLFPEYKLIFQRIQCGKIIPDYPLISKKRPLIVHSPSALYAKGTNFILPAIEELKKELDFDFVLLHDITRQEVLETIKNADIVIDQLVIGGYGMAAVEGMAHGKPVLSYIMPAVFEAGIPVDCPIINTNRDNLKENLKKLIQDSQLRHETGKKSRAYVEHFHDADKIAQQLAGIYRELIHTVQKNN